MGNAYYSITGDVPLVLVKSANLRTGNMQKSELKEIFNDWDTLELVDFQAWLKLRGWKAICDGMWKLVYRRDDVVIKFDANGDTGRGSHTAYEYRQWLYARPHKRKYLLKPIAYHRGLLVTPRLPNICSRRYSCECDGVDAIARRLRICDWKNHGFTASGKLKFFDSDSFGTGWYNWKERQK